MLLSHERSGMFNITDQHIHNTSVGNSRLLRRFNLYNNTEGNKSAWLYQVPLPGTVNVLKSLS